jgi:hypothetical protein
LVSSNDGVAWSSSGTIPTSIMTSVNYITYGNGIYLACGNGVCSLAYSYDRVNWTGVAGSTALLATANYALFGGTLWVATGQTPSIVVYSLDGINWNSGIGLTTNRDFFSCGYGLAYNGQFWIMTGQGTRNLQYSSDGINWGSFASNSNKLAIGYSVCWNGTAFVATGTLNTNAVAYSTSGTAWTYLTITGLTAGYGVSWNGKNWVIVGTGGTGSGIFYSASLDGSTGWTSATAQNISPVSVNYNGTQFVAACSGTTNNISYSKDGITWYNRTIPYTIPTQPGSCVIGTLGQNLRSGPLDINTGPYYNQQNYDITF